MSYDYVIPKKKSNGWQMIIGLLVLIMSAGVGMFIKVMDQKDESLKNSQAAYERQLDQLDENHKQDVRELNTELESRKTKLESANEKLAEYKGKYEGAEVNIKKLEEYIKDIKMTSGMPIDSMIALARLKGELREYEVALNTANSRIDSLESEVRSLEADLLASRQRIIELKDSLAMSENEVLRLNQELISKKDISENGVRQLEQAFMFELSGDALPDKRKFLDKKFRYYQDARYSLIDVLRTFANPDLLNVSINRLNNKMEKLRPGSTIELERIKKGFNP